MPKLHQVLAVDADLEGQYKKICAETRKVLSKPAMFTGFNRKLEMFNDSDTTDYPAETQEMTTTVKDRLNYTGKAAAAYLDAVYQKEATNQKAVATLMVDNTILGENSVF